MALLEVNGLSAAYGGRLVLSALNFTLEPGEVLAITGLSGAGKSTLGLALAGLLDQPGRVAGGTAVLGGTDLLQLDEPAWQKRRGVDVASVFQDPSAALNPLRRIGDMLRQTLRRMGLPSAMARDRLAGVGFADPEAVMRAYPHQLSGGMRQRAVIAMALCGSPRLVIADEPTGSLDAGARDGILALLAGHAREQRAGLILITHDRTIARDFADRELRLEEGRLTQPPPGRARGPRRAADRAGGKPAVVLRNLAYRPPGGKNLFRDLNLTLLDGEIFGLTGASGSGKSSLARLIAGLERPHAGEVEVFGAAPVPGRSPVQMVFQDSRGSLNPLQTGMQALSEPLIWRGVPREDVPAQARSLAASVALAPEILARRPRRMSGGERQRLAIARALACNPRLLICDEITSALDPATRDRILDLLLALRAGGRLTLIVISHDPEVIGQVSDRQAVLEGGRLRGG